MHNTLSDGFQRVFSTLLDDPESHIIFGLVKQILENIRLMPQTKHLGLYSNHRFKALPCKLSQYSLVFHYIAKNHPLPQTARLASPSAKEQEHGGKIVMLINKNRAGIAIYLIIPAGKIHFIQPSGPPSQLSANLNAFAVKSFYYNRIMPGPCANSFVFRNITVARESSFKRVHRKAHPLLPFQPLSSFQRVFIPNSPHP